MPQLHPFTVRCKYQLQRLPNRHKPYSDHDLFIREQVGSTDTLENRSQMLCRYFMGGASHYAGQNFTRIWYPGWQHAGIDAIESAGTAQYQPLVVTG